MIITRGLAELTCIGTAYGASPLTFLGLSGVGDLFLTCSSSNSRNYTVGYRLGRGESLDEIMKTLGSVAEGVSTTKAVKTVIDELGISAPIAQAVYEVLYEGTWWHFTGTTPFLIEHCRQSREGRRTRIDDAASLERTRTAAHSWRSRTTTVDEARYGEHGLGYTYAPAPVVHRRTALITAGVGDCPIGKMIFRKKF